MVNADAVARDLVQRTLAAAPTLGRGRLLCIDGPAGSGKTTLADAVAAVVPPSTCCRVVHMDDVFTGWDGLADGVSKVDRLLIEPLSRALPGGYRRYDWTVGREVEWHDVHPVDLLILEGVGAGALEYDAQITTLVWVEAPRDLRVERGLARDARVLGLERADDDLRSHWVAWTQQEDEHFARQRTFERADIVVTGLGVPETG